MNSYTADADLAVENTNNRKEKISQNNQKLHYIEVYNNVLLTNGKTLLSTDFIK